MDAMSADLRTLLTGLYERGRDHDAREPEHGKRLRNLEPETARLISILVRSGGRRRVLEIGTRTAELVKSVVDEADVALGGLAGQAR